MKLAIALSTVLFFGIAKPAAAAARPAVEHFPMPPLNGQPLPFSSAVRVGDILYLSGQIGMAPDGKLPPTFDAQARQAMENVGTVLIRAGVRWGDVFLCTVMLSDMKNWPAFNSVYVTYFPDAKYPARSAFGANGLALGAMIELECQAYAGKRQ